MLTESFTGWYLWHSKRTLKGVEVVRAAIVGDRPVGVVMLKTLENKIGYVYYIAVAKEYRRRKVASRLLDNSLDYFSSLGMKEVYASVEEDNPESARLFGSKGFAATGYGEVSRKYGRLHALAMYRKMLVVPGEMLLFREIT